MAPAFKRTCFIVLVAASAASADPTATIPEHEGRWEMAYGEVFYRVNGRVRNHDEVPLASVRLRVELVHADGETVFSVEGFNQGAEILGGVEGFDTGLSEADKQALVQPIAPGGTDGFRLGIAKSDLPPGARFHGYRVSAVAPAVPASPLTTTTTAAGPLPPTAAKRVGVNSADADALEAVPGISEAIAKAIVSQRAKTGPFVQLEELETVAQLRPVLADVVARLSLD